MKVEVHVLQLYELLEVKGKGAYGIVWKAKDKYNNQIVALKKVLYLLIFPLLGIRCIPQLNRCIEDIQRGSIFGVDEGP